MEKVKKGLRVKIVAGEHAGLIGTVIADLLPEGASVRTWKKSVTVLKNEHLEPIKAELMRMDGTSDEVIPTGKKKSFDYKHLQQLVGGTVDLQRLPKTGGRMILYDSGKLDGLTINEQASALWRQNYPIEEFPLNNDQTIVGDVVILYDARMFR